MHHSTKRRVVLGMTTGGLLVGGLGLGVAQADAGANGAAVGSPGLLSGNLVQVPVNAPVNVCGNSISVIGILDTAAGNKCVNTDANAATADGSAKGSPGAGSGNLIQIPVNAPVNVCGNSASGVGVGDSAWDNTCTNSGAGGSAGSAGSTANGGSSHSPGVGSGNTIQLPVNAPVNVCGNSVSGLGIGDTASGNTCANGGSGGAPSQPAPPCGCHATPPVNPPAATTGRPKPIAPPYRGVVSSGSGHAAGSAETGSLAGALAAPLSAGLLGGGLLGAIG